MTKLIGKLQIPNPFKYPIFSYCLHIHLNRSAIYQKPIIFSE